MIRVILLLDLLLCASSSMAQSKYRITGYVCDTSGNPLPGAGIWLYYGNDSLHTNCNDEGYFIFNQVGAKAFRLKVSMLGYAHMFGDYNTDTPIIISMTPRPRLLQEVIVKGQVLPISMRNDTIAYNLSQYHLREDATLTDLLKRLPGLEYDQEGGLKFMGQPIDKMKINGQELLVGNMHDWVRLVPLAAVDKIQVLDDYGKMAALTGRTTGMGNKVINLETKKGLGTTKRLAVLAGTGTSGRYNVDINASIINNRRQIIGEVLADNTIPGAIDNSYGKALFLFRDQLNGQFYTNGGMFAEQSKVRQVTNSSAIVLTTAGIQNNDNESRSIATTNNYYFTERLDFKDKKNNSLKFQVLGKYNEQIEQYNIQSIQSGIQHVEQAIGNVLHTTAPELSSSLYGSIHLPRKGALLAFGIDADLISNRSDQQTDTRSRMYTTNISVYKDSLLYQRLLRKNNIVNINVQTSWISPVSAKSDFEVKYRLKSNTDKNRLETNWEDEIGEMRRVDSLSQQFVFKVTEHKVGVNIKRKGDKLGFTIGGNFIYALYSRRNDGWLVPELTVAYKLGEKSRLSFHYESNPTYPVYQQVRSVSDRSNPLFPIIGNPYLKAALYNIISLDYRYVGKNMLFLSITGTPIIDKTVTNVILDKDSAGGLIQETRFLNTNGNYTIGGNYTFSMPFNEGRWQVCFEGSSNYLNNIFYLDGLRNTGSDLSLKQTIRTSINVNWMELNTAIAYGINRTQYSDKAIGIQEIHTWNLQINPKVFLDKTWSIWADVNKQFSSGYTGGVTSNLTNINATVEKKARKCPLSFRLQGTNLLNQRTGLTQTVVGNTVTQIRSSQLGRYVLFSIYLDLKKTRNKTSSPLTIS